MPLRRRMAEPALQLADRYHTRSRPRIQARSACLPLSARELAPVANRGLQMERVRQYWCGNLATGALQCDQGQCLRNAICIPGGCFYGFVNHSETRI